MAIDVQVTERGAADKIPLDVPVSSSPLWNALSTILGPVASLRLTVVLFALSIFLILAGTFAQVDKDIWEVVGQYFRCWIAWIPFQVFFPLSFFPTEPQVPGGIWFPGGKLIGLLLAANLLSAHLIRFQAHARGTRLLVGLGAIALGVAATWIIIAAGGNSKGLQGAPLVPYSTLWIGFEGALGLLCLAAAFATVQVWSKPPPASRQTRAMFVRGLTVSATAGLMALLGWLLWTGEAARPSDASLRILWQLTQGTLASAALLAGCWIVFSKRAGIVLLHSGIGLMMFYELHVAMTAVETQLNLEEGETTNFVHDIRTLELAVIDKTKSDEERVTAIPRSVLLSRQALSGQPIDLPELPFKIEVKRFEPNSHLRAASVRDKNPATAGLGIEWFAESKKPGTGTDTDSKVDMAAAYVTLTDRATNRPIGTYLVGMLLSMSNETDLVNVDDKVYELALRPKRYYKSYQFTLRDVRKEDYIGTTTPRHYASTVHIVDPSRNVDEEKTIWMNNPLRFADETFYQSNYYREKDTGIEHTTLSVVANSGWMMPYVACMLVAIGMLTHFLLLLVRFLMRGEVPEPSAGAASLKERLGIAPKVPLRATESLPNTEASSPWPTLAATAAIVLAAGIYIGVKAMPPKASDLDYDLYAFGQLPVVQDGRVKPLDSAAYSALLAISSRSHVEIGHDEDKIKIPAIKWLLDVIAETEAAEEYAVFRVDNLELQETVGVKKREGMRYSRKELRPRLKLRSESLAALRGAQVPEAVLQKLGELKDQRLDRDEFRERLGKLFDRTEMAAFGAMVVSVAEHDEFHKQVELARTVAKKDRRQLSVYQRKVLELDDKLTTFDNLQFAFGLQHRIRGETQPEILRSFQAAIQFEQMLAEQGQPVFAIGPVEKDQQWRTMAGASLDDIIRGIRDKKEPTPAVVAWDEILKSYTDKKASAFNRAVEGYLKQVDAQPPRDVNPTAVRFEAFFNHFQPFTVADHLYVLAFLIGACGWLGWTQVFNRAAFWLMILTLSLHTFALIGRIYISGRPPVTNLYSSAVFIGWGCVALGLIMEVIYRIGIGNLIASVAGYATLLIADGLAQNGDTFTVLQAVLDTQFWLATHVTCITLGYATTYLAGGLGVVYVLRGVLTPSLTPEIRRDLNRMIYGMLCFSIFFSFVGTVLGGLWADDSWGRFWGWDPKENGALIIVLWNALALHARWGGMVKERGLAVLAIGGNIFVSWSWWGVNELGAGLHSYGFTEGTVMKLALVVLSQLVLIGIGVIPKRYWRSFRQEAPA